MPFTLYPILSFFEELYQMPIGQERFSQYLEKLQGSDKDGLKAAIMGYNPMAKNHALQRINELQELQAETKAKEIIQSINTQYLFNDQYHVIINLADDLHGAWSNRYATEFDSKFNFKGIFNKGFCTPYFWTSEELSEADIFSELKKRCIGPFIGWKIELKKICNTFLNKRLMSLNNVLIR